jgi:enoyl-CoA hydratase
LILSDVLPGAATTPYAGGKLLLTVGGGIGILTFNNPEKLNAISVEVAQGLAEVLPLLRDDPAVRVLILTGAGEKAFISGGDISQFDKTRPNAEVAAKSAARFRERQDMLANFPKPTISAIRGYCLGGGLGTALNTDIRIAAYGSTFGIPAAKLGIAYGFDGLTKLVSLVGPARARLILYTGMGFQAEEALQFGLIDRLVAPDQLWPATLQLARQMAENAPLAIAAAKITIREVLKDHDKRDLQAIKVIDTQCMDSDDFREGRQAFMEKRAPKFTGR